MCTFGNFLGPVLIAAHTANNLDLGDKFENEGYESDHKISVCLIAHAEIYSMDPRNI